MGEPKEVASAVILSQVQVLALPSLNQNLGKARDLSETQFPHLLDGDKSSHLVGAWGQSPRK